MSTHKELTPLRAILLYTVAMALVMVCEFQRVSSWARDAWSNITAMESPPVFALHISATEGAQPGVTGKIPPPPSVSWPLLDPVALVTNGYGFGPAKNDPWFPAAPSLLSLKTNKPASSNAGPIVAHKVLIVGDSEIAEGFGPALQRELDKYPSVKVLRKGIYSTGFIHQENLNWARTLRALINQFHPDLIIVHLGANDPIDIVPKTGRRMYFGNDQWKEVYGSRLADFLKAVSEKKIMTFWVGLPIMGSPAYCEKIKVLNSMFRQECDKVPGCFYMDTWSALTNSKGKYASYLRGPGGELVRIRAKDHVHLTGGGGKILTTFFLKTASRHVIFQTVGKVSSSN